YKRHVHALRERYFVRVDLRKDRLLRQAEAVVAVAVEALGIHAAEVADTRQGDTNQSIQKFVHAPTAERHAAADLVALAKTKATDRHAGLGDLGALAGDLGELLRRFLHAVLVLKRLADAHVDGNLLQARQAELVGAAQLFGQRANYFLFVSFH